MYEPYTDQTEIDVCFGGNGSNADLRLISYVAISEVVIAISVRQKVHSSLEEIAGKLCKRVTVII